MKHDFKQTKRWIKYFAVTAFSIAVMLAPGTTYAQKSNPNDNEQFTPDGRFIVVTIKDGPAALLPGQTLRFSLYNPAPAGTPAAGGRVRVFDGSGAAIGQTSMVQIPAGTFYSFEIRRDSLNLPGDPNTGRLQVRAEIELTVWHEGSTRNVPPAVEFPSTRELVDQETGRTILIGLLLPAIQKVG